VTTPDCGLRIRNCGLRIADCGLDRIVVVARTLHCQSNPPLQIRNPKSAIRN